MNWNVEEMKLLNEKCNTYFGKEKIYSCENIDRQEKIAFIDKFNDSRMTYLLNLINKFEADKESLPKNDWGDIKTVSLKAWLNRTDTLNMIDRDYHHGKIRFLSMERWITDADRQGSYDTYENIVDECFHRVLRDCEKEEKKYFHEHDEYSILKKKFENKNYNTTFGVHISMWSSGKICICGDNDNEREITIDELKLLLSKYEELDKLVEKITSEISIEY